jgi:hypothetical protein
VEDLSVTEAGPNHGLTVAQIEDWQERFAAGAENALRARPKNVEAFCTSTFWGRPRRSSSDPTTSGE